MALANNKASTAATAHLASSLWKKTPWDIDTHRETMIEAKKSFKKEKAHYNDLQLQQSLNKLTPNQRQTVERGSKTGSWLTAVPNTLAGTEIGNDEKRDSACIRYSM